CGSRPWELAAILTRCRTSTAAASDIKPSSASVRTWNAQKFSRHDFCSRQTHALALHSKSFFQHAWKLQERPGQPLVRAHIGWRGILLAALDFRRAVLNIVRAFEADVGQTFNVLSRWGEVLWGVLVDHYCQHQKSTGDTRNC